MYCTCQNELHTRNWDCTHFLQTAVALFLIRTFFFKYSFLLSAVQQKYIDSKGTRNKWHLYEAKIKLSSNLTGKYSGFLYFPIDVKQ